MPTSRPSPCSTRAGSRERSAENSFELAYLLIWYAADRRRRTASPERALDRLGNAAPMLRSSLLFLLATSQCLGDPDAGFDTLARAKALQATLDDPNLDRLAASLEVHMRGFVAQFGRAIEVRKEAARLSRAARDVWSEVDTAVWEPLAAVYCGRPDEATRWLAEYKAVAERVGHQTVLWFFNLSEAMAALTKGQLDAAESAARHSLAFGRARQIGWRFADSLYLGHINFCQGRAAEAIAHLAGCHKLRAAENSLLGDLGDEPDVDACARRRPGRRRHPERSSAAPAAARTHSDAGRMGRLAKIIVSLALLGRRDEAAALLASAEDLVATGVQWYARTPCLHDGPAASQQPAPASGRARRPIIRGPSHKPTRRMAFAGLTRASGMPTCCWRVPLSATENVPACCLLKPCRSTNRSACPALHSARAPVWLRQVAGV